MLAYAIIDDDKVRINVTVSYYDQYGAPAASGDRLQITVGATGQGLRTRLPTVVLTASG